MTEHKTPVYGFKRPKKEVYPFEITDESNPGEVVRITLREPTIPKLMKISESIQYYTNFYMTPDEKTGERPEIVVDGEIVELTDDLIELACGIQGLQASPVYNFEEIIFLINTMEQGMLQVLDKSKELAQKFAALMKNPTQAVTMPLSQPISNEQEGIPNSITE